MIPRMLLSARSIKLCGALLVAFVALYLASQTTFYTMYDRLVEEYENETAKRERVREIEATPAMLFNLNIKTDDVLKDKLVTGLVEWVQRTTAAFENESTLFRDVNVEVFVTYKNRLAEQKAMLPDFEKLQCEAFKKTFERPTRMNTYYDRPRLKKRGVPESDRAFRKKLNVCYRVYAPTAEVVREHEKRFYDAVLKVATDAHLIKNDDFEFDPTAFFELDASVKNNFVHRVMQLSEECYRHLAEIDSTLDHEKLLEDTRVLDYETDSVFIRPAQKPLV